MTPSPKLILASGSPRRKEFLTRLGFQFDVIKPETVEQVRPDETASTYVQRNAIEKAREIFHMWTSDPHHAKESFAILAADTVVARNERILEKPKTHEDARLMLRYLSGAMHEVLTGVCVMGKTQNDQIVERSFLSCTEVQFKELSAAEIEGYILSGEPMDKAGAYAIQGLAAYMVRAIHGSYTNVVGLPLAEVVDVLEHDFNLYPFHLPSNPSHTP